MARERQRQRLPDGLRTRWPLEIIGLAACRPTCELSCTAKLGTAEICIIVGEGGGLTSACRVEQHARAVPAARVCRFLCFETLREVLELALEDGELRSDMGAVGFARFALGEVVRGDGVACSGVDQVREVFEHGGRREDRMIGGGPCQIPVVTNNQ